MGFKFGWEKTVMCQCFSVSRLLYQRYCVLIHIIHSSLSLSRSPSLPPRLSFSQQHELLFIISISLWHCIIFWVFKTIKWLLGASYGSYWMAEKSVVIGLISKGFLVDTNVFVYLLISFLVHRIRLWSTKYFNALNLYCNNTFNDYAVLQPSV